MLECCGWKGWEGSIKPPPLVREAVAISRGLFTLVEEVSASLIMPGSSSP